MSIFDFPVDVYEEPHVEAVDSKRRLSVLTDEELWEEREEVIRNQQVPTKYDQWLEDQESEREEALKNLHKRERIKEKRKERAENCGKWFYSRNHHTLDIYKYQYDCNQPDICDRCAERRAEEIKAQIINVAVKGGVRYTICDDKRATQLMSEIGKQKVRRLPLEGGKNAIFIEANTGRRIGKLYSKRNIEELKAIEWDEITCTPKGRNQSGLLGKQEIDTKDLADHDFQAEVKSFSFVKKKGFDDEWLLKYILQNAVNAVIFDAELPETEEDVKELYELLDNAVLDVAKDVGYKVASKQRRTVNVNISYIQEAMVRIKSFRELCLILHSSARNQISDTS